VVGQGQKNEPTGDPQGNLVGGNVYVNAALGMTITLPGTWQLGRAVPTQSTPSADCSGPLCGNPEINAQLKYRSGEEILKGDRVLFHGSPAVVELVAVDPNDPEHVWYVSRFGGGVLVNDPKVSGRTFISCHQLAEYAGLQFISRLGRS
jgi:hypothetical protein